MTGEVAMDKFGFLRSFSKDEFYMYIDEGCFCIILAKVKQTLVGKNGLLVDSVINAISTQ